jgi:hypothetical protein
MSPTISIPHNARLKINLGDKVDFGDPLFEIVDEEIIKIDIASKIKVKPERMFRYLTCLIGDQVEKDMVIAKKTTLFSSNEFICEYSGTLQNINHQDGSIDIKIQKSCRRMVNSFFKGTIEKIDKYKIQIDIQNIQKFEADEVSSDFGGPIFYFEHENQYFSMNEDEIKDHVIIAKTIKTNILAKSKTLQAAGYIFEEGEVDPNFHYAKIKEISKLISAKKNCLVSNLDKTIYIY